MNPEAFAAVNTPEWKWYVGWYATDKSRRYGQAAQTGALHGYRAGRASTVSWETITPTDREQHAQECRWGCVFDEAHRAFGECDVCGGATEAVGPDELSRCCDRRTILTPEES